MRAVRRDGEHNVCEFSPNFAGEECLWMLDPVVPSSTIYRRYIALDMSFSKVRVLRHLSWHSTEISRLIRIDVLVSLYFVDRGSFVLRYVENR